MTLNMNINKLDNLKLAEAAIAIMRQHGYEMYLDADDPTDRNVVVRTDYYKCGTNLNVGLYVCSSEKHRYINIHVSSPTTIAWAIRSKYIWCTPEHISLDDESAIRHRVLKYVELLNKLKEIPDEEVFRDIIKSRANSLAVYDDFDKIAKWSVSDIELNPSEYVHYTTGIQPYNDLQRFSVDEFEQIIHEYAIFLIRGNV